MPFTRQLSLRQLVLLGRVARAPVGSLLRSSTFIGDRLVPKIGQRTRRVGRPRLDWTSEVLKEGERLLGRAALETYVMDGSQGAAGRWLHALRKAYGEAR